MKRVLILGGYGNFGTHIAAKLSGDANLQLILSGRSEEKCRKAAALYKDAPNPAIGFAFDIEQDLPAALNRLRPDIVIHTSGPYQGQDYTVAEACIEYGCHYIDLADAREFVAGIDILDDKARAKGVMVISGASSVPCLTAAIMDEYLPQFGTIQKIDYGISTAQRTNTGLATTKAILGYVGQPFNTLIRGRQQPVYGWQGLVARRYLELGLRLLGNCDVPDLALFPARYPDLETIRFRAGLEIPFMHLGLWALSWLVRFWLLPNLAPLAEFLLKSSRLFDGIGSDRSALHFEMTGTDKTGAPKTATFYLLAGSGHGPFIPSVPAILCTRLLAEGTLLKPGASACLGILSLAQYLEALKGLDIRTIRD